MHRLRRPASIRLGKPIVATCASFVVVLLLAELVLDAFDLVPFMRTQFHN